MGGRLQGELAGYDAATLPAEAGPGQRSSAKHGPVQDPPHGAHTQLRQPQAPLALRCHAAELARRPQPPGPPTETRGPLAVRAHRPTCSGPAARATNCRPLELDGWARVESQARTRHHHSPPPHRLSASAHTPGPRPERRSGRWPRRRAFVHSPTPPLSTPSVHPSPTSFRPATAQCPPEPEDTSAPRHHEPDGEAPAGPGAPRGSPTERCAAGARSLALRSLRGCRTEVHGCPLSSRMRIRRAPHPLALARRPRRGYPRSSATDSVHGASSEPLDATGSTPPPVTRPG
jgi:hypothetical protein